MKSGFNSSPLTKDDSWIIELSLVPQELRDTESELMQTRWFDYRHLLPAQATYLFAFYYDQVYREFYAMHRDYRKAGEVNPLPCADIFESNELLALWRGRQAADQIGCKYDFYLRFAFKRYFERAWKFMPRPNQLYGEELVLDIVDAWAEVKSCSLQVATLKRFQPNAYVGHPDQDAYYAYLVEQINLREHKHMLLSRLVFKDQVLPLDVAGRHFPADVLSRAKFF